MKTKSLILTFIFVLFSLVGQAQNSVFEKLSARSDIQVVHITKSLLSMIPKVNAGGIDIAQLADKLEQIDIYTSDSVDAVKFMESEAAGIKNDKSYETFMTIKEKDETIIFYGKKSGEIFKDLVMISNKATEHTIMRLQGEFTTKDIQSIITNK